MPALDAPIDIQGPGIDASPTIRSLLSRLVAQMEMWGAAMASRPYDFTLARDETIDSLRERVRRTGPEFAGYVRAVGEGDRFGETFVDATGKSPHGAGHRARGGRSGRCGRRPAQLVPPIDR